MPPNVAAVADSPVGRVSPATPHEPIQPRQTSARRIGAFAAVAVLVGALAIDLALIRVGLDPQDEGYFLEQATRVLHGQLPYRDFDSLYTPGLLYAHALLLQVFGGPNILILRVVGLAARVGLAIGLYALCRPIARPFFALLPSLYVLVGLDPLPDGWEPHPGWPAAALSVLAALAFSRLPERSPTQRRWWLVAIGVVTALAFATKQNVGVFLGLALVVYVVWQGTRISARPVVSPNLRRLQVVSLVVLAAAVTWLIAPHFSPLTAGYFLAPVVIVGGVPLTSMSVARRGRGINLVLAEVGLLGIGFVAVSVPWLIALLNALDGQWRLLVGFVGAVNQSILWYPPELPGNGAWASVLGMTGSLALAVRVRQRGALVLLALVALAYFAGMTVLLTAQPADSLVQAVLSAPGRAGDGLQAFLPLAGLVAATLWCMNTPPGAQRWRLGWITVAGALMFLAEYPRMDTIHLAWSAPLALGAGAVILDRFHAWLSRRWAVGGLGQVVLAFTLVLAPLTTTLPTVIERAVTLYDPVDKSRLAVFTPIQGLTGVRGVLVNQNDQATMIAAARFVAEATQPGEPIFVYPTSPLLYVMTDRPNPTRFEHLYPGAATPDELAKLIASLQGVRVVVVHGPSLTYWGPPGENQPLEDYLATQYQQVARFGDYRVLMANR